METNTNTLWYAVITSANIAPTSSKTYTFHVDSPIEYTTNCIESIHAYSCDDSEDCAAKTVEMEAMKNEVYKLMELTLLINT